MGKRGPKPSLSHEDKVAALKNFPIFDDFDKLKKESDPVWQDVCNFINDKYNLDDTDGKKKITKRNIQNYVAQDRNGVLFDLTNTVQMISENNLDLDSSEMKRAAVRKEGKRLDEEKTLLTLQSNVLYKPVIKEISTFPFSIMHWSMEAVDFANRLNTTNKPEFIFARIGTFCANFNFPDGTESKPIYLYSFGARIHDEFIPFCHLSTEENSATIFNRFLNEIVRNDAPIPKQIIIDHNFNQYEAANSVYNVNLLLENYVTQCFYYLSENESNSLPKCIVLTNIKFVLGNFLNCDCVRNTISNSVKYFYIYCIALLSFQRSLHDFQEILQKVFVISLSEYQGKITHEYFEDFMLKVKGFKIDEIYDKKYITIIENEYKNAVDSVDIAEINFDKCPDVLNYIVEIVMKAKKLTVNTGNECHRNAFYSKEMSKILIKCCAEFVLWTKVMHTSDDIKDSLSFDELVNNYKVEYECFLKDTDPHPTIETYLMAIIEYSEKKLKSVKDNIYLSNKITAKENDQLDYLFHSENWMGRDKIISDNDRSDSSDSFSDDSDEQHSSNESDDYDDPDITSIIDSVCHELSMKESLTTSQDTDINDELVNQNKKIIITKKVESRNKDMTRGIYVRACPEIDLLIQKPITKIKNRKIIKNYNLLKPRSVGKKKIFATTSSFIDSIVEILVTSYYTIQKFQDSVNEFSETLSTNRREFLNLLQEYLKTFNVTKLYAARMKLITGVYESKNDKFTWTKSLGEFFECIMYPNIFIKFQCTSCQTTNYQYSNLIKLSLNDLPSKELTAIIHNHLVSNRNSCSSCSTINVSCQYSINHLFAIDVEDKVDKQSAIKLKQLIPILSIDNDTFVLTGAISFEQPIGNNSLRHYVAYVRSLKGIWSKYDDTNTESSTPEKVNKNATIFVALLFYVKYKTVEDKNSCPIRDQINNDDSQDIHINNVIVKSGDTLKEKNKTVLSDESNTIQDISNTMQDISNKDTHLQLNYQHLNSENMVLYDEKVESVNTEENFNKSLITLEKNIIDTTQESLEDNSYTERRRSRDSTDSIDSNKFTLSINFHYWRNLIKNGLILPPIKLPTQNVRLINTCPLDSIVEVLTAAYCFESSFNYFIYEHDLSGKPKNEIFETVYKYVGSKSRDLYYMMRLEYCISKSQLYKQTKYENGLVIDCRDNVVRLFESIMSEEYCIKKTIKCKDQKCSYVNTNHYRLQTVNTDLEMDGALIYNLKNYLTDYYSEKTEQCYKCKKGVTSISYKINSFLCVELETNFLLHKNMMCNLNSIPASLNVSKEEYNLLGVVAFDNAYQEGGLLHYYAFIKLPDEMWEHRDDLKDEITLHSKRSILQIRPALLFYSRKNVYRCALDRYF